MKFAKLLTAVLALALAGSYTLAQEKETGTKESLEKKAGEKSGKEGEKAKKFDRGDAKAEKILKKAYIRVQSAESDGLKKFVADATVDLSFMGQVMKVEGSLLWKSGQGILFDVEVDEENPMSGMLTGRVKEAFEPFMRFALGFEAWDVKFKEANFSFGKVEKKKDDKKRVEGEEAKKDDGKVIVVKFKDKTKTSETYVVKENKVTAVRTTISPDSKNLVVYKFEYKDKGKSLRIEKIETTAELEGIELPEMPEDPKNPVPKEKSDGKSSMESSIEVAERQP